MKIRYDDIRIDRVLLENYIKEIKVLSRKISGLDDINKYRDDLKETIKNFLGAKYMFLLDSGTSALEIACLASGLKKGDSIIVPAISCPATYAPLISLGIEPIYIDITEKNLALNEEKIERNIKRNTKAILVVHLYGLMANMPAIFKIATKHKLKVIEDACQSFGSEMKGKKSGCFGDFGVFSFRYYKTLSSIDGQGGAIVCQDSKNAKKVKEIISKRKLFLKIMSIPFLDLVVLRVKLRYLKLILKSKIQSSLIYQKLLKKIPEVRILPEPVGSFNIKQFYPIFVPERDKLFDFLNKKGIYLESPYEIFGGFRKLPLEKLKKDYPNSLKYIKEILLLPLFPFIKREEIEYIASLIKNFYE